MEITTIRQTEQQKNCFLANVVVIAAQYQFVPIFIFGIIYFTLMSDIKRVGDSGIHTVEGAVAGHKAALLSQQREKQQLEYEATKNKIKQENSSGVSRIDDKFSRSIETGEQVFRQKTIGLVTLDEFREARTVANNIIVDSKAENCLKESLQKEEEEKKLLKKQKELLSKKKMKQSLSFMQDDDDENSDSNAETEVDFVLNKKRNATCTTNTDNNSSSTLTFTNENKKMKKNPDVNTSFLPDKARDEFLEQERVRLKNEWIDKQERIKKEYLMVTYSYWDGGGHRKEVKIQKGYTIGKFLTVVKETLTKEFPELRGVSSDSLLYIKEDLIIPHVSISVYKICKNLLYACLFSTIVFLAAIHIL